MVLGHDAAESTSTKKKTRKAELFQSGAKRDC